MAPCAPVYYGSCISGEVVASAHLSLQLEAFIALYAAPHLHLKEINRKEVRRDTATTSTTVISGGENFLKRTSVLNGTHVAK